MWRRPPGVTRILLAVGVGAAVASVAAAAGVRGAVVRERSTAASGIAWSSASVDHDYPTVLNIPNEKNPTIPRVTLKVATAPYDDHSYAIIGVVKGWFRQAGISAQLKASDIPQIAPQLLNGQLDIGAMCVSCWVGTLDQSSNNKMFTFSDTFLGTSILANPNGNYVTTAELVHKKVPLRTAIKRAVAQMKGHSFYFAADPSTEPMRTFVLQLAGVKYSDFPQSGALPDVKLLELATGGRADFVQVAGGPNMLRLIKSGWKVIVRAKELFDTGDRSMLKASDFFSGWMARKQWLAANHAEALRMASVMYRIIDYKVNHMAAAAGVQLPYLNSLAGTSFGVSDMGFFDHTLDKFWTFDQQRTFYVPNKSLYYYKLSINALIARQVQSGILKRAHNPDEFIIADDTWFELRNLRTRTQQILGAVSTKLKTATGNAAQQATKYVTLAKAFAAGRDYLDSFRFANAARLWLG